MNSQLLGDKPKPVEYNCLIAVTDNGYGFLLKSTPDLIDCGVFDGCDLEGNINKNQKDIPKDYGIYRCKIMVHAYKYDTDGGTEYDCDTWIEDVKEVLPKIV